ncbi:MULTISPECIES: L-fuculokinase [unclassified Meiothermus]|uniref:FGGY-family carbohydrate kinase n=1 Tax=unclassified Meiothermus TaxID=370471 RepID=UPI000D7C8556|nr:MULTISPECIES: FGGY family carbohydrate kinase [unclassified Meiothermus]PZA06007.1 carbohydrate kinase [Meiothermus sp. Pnk-1]RYM35244.1 carbohydrate kinase [Meiothermus sp. PNK-Is4]
MVLLGIDLGSSFIKVGAFTPQGEEVGLIQAPTPLYRTGTAQGHYLAEELWESVAGLTRELLGRIGRPERLGAVGISSFGESGVLLGRDGRLRHPEVMVWYDERPRPILERLSQRTPALEPARLRRRTGLLPDPTYSLGKLLWLRAEHPELFQDGPRWTSVADWIAFRLTGALQMGLTQASRTLLFDLRERRWMEDLLLALDLDPDLPAPLRPPGAPIGRVTPEAARQTGLPPGLAVMEAGHDQACAAAGLGALEPGSVINACGTAETLLQVIGPEGLDRALRSSTAIVGHHALAGHYYLMATLRASGSVFDWWVRILDGAGEGAEAVRPRLTQAASRVPLGAEGLRFVPHLGPLSDDPGEAALPGGVFWGLRESHGPGHLARALMEGLSFESYRLLQRLREAGGEEGKGPIRAAGGPTANALWMQIKAEMLGRPLEVYTCPHAAAWGAAFLAWRHLRGQAGRARGLKPRARFIPHQPEAAARLRRSYTRVLKALTQAQAALAEENP